MSSLHSFKKRVADRLSFCPTPVGSFNGVYQDFEKAKNIGVRKPIACDSWMCPYCGPKKLKQLLYRIFNGQIAKDLKNIYGQKFLTLTCPGKAFRSQFTPTEAHEMMQDAFRKTIKQLHEKYGEFDYLKVVEKHKDGYPHYHILLTGNNIAGAGIKKVIEDLWRGKYRMGFIKLVVIKKGFRAGIKYITKYLCKDLNVDGSGGIISIAKGKRIFTASKGALVKIEKEKKNWIVHEFVAGFVWDAKNGKSQIFEMDILGLPGADIETRVVDLDEFCDFVLHGQFMPDFFYQAPLQEAA